MNVDDMKRQQPGAVVLVLMQAVELPFVVCILTGWHFWAETLLKKTRELVFSVCRKLIPWLGTIDIRHSAKFKGDGIPVLKAACHLLWSRFPVTVIYSGIDKN